ncbi:GNAT family N-acetyltransferase [Ligilactobacillus salivarius]|nr:GNAT family N-acetyltransferase [Ligilactobacillus salivarius]MDE1525056.1 GNAT family N-acetyltransferase [Ligilactobacillus salivarius]
MRKCHRSEWRKFRKYHYLNSDITVSAQCFELFNNNNEPIGFIAYINQPSNHKFYGKYAVKRITRLVILPDYQGIGLGTRLLDFMGGYLKEKGHMCSINTTAKNLIFALSRSKKWSMRSYSKNTKPARFEGSTKTVRLEVARIGVRKASFMFK